MPSINDDLSDRFIAHAIYLRRLQTGTVKKIIKVLNQADREMLAKLNARLAAGATRGFTTHRLQQLINEVRALNDVAYKALGKTLKSDLLDLAEYEADFTKRLLEEPLKRLNFGIDLVGVSPQTLRAVVTATPFQGKLLGQHVSRQASRRLKAIRTDIQQGVIQGLTNDEMIRRIRGTRAARYSDGVLEVSRREAEALTRTSVAAVAGSSRDELYRANSDIVEGEQWSAILDGRTTLVCQNNSGHTRSLDPETGEWGEWSNGYEGRLPGPLERAIDAHTDTPRLSGAGIRYASGAGRPAGDPHQPGGEDAPAGAQGRACPGSPRSWAREVVQADSQGA